MVNRHRDWNPPGYVPSKNQALWAFPGTDPTALSGLRGRNGIGGKLHRAFVVMVDLPPVVLHQ